MLPLTRPCRVRNASSAWLMTSTMALPIPSTSKLLVMKTNSLLGLQRPGLQRQKMHAGLGLFQQGKDAGHRERHIAAQFGRRHAERAQAHFAYDEARAKLDAGSQQGLEIADAALAV